MVQPQFVMPDAALTAPEVQRLTDNETRIERGLQTFYEVGSALLDIRDARLYRATHPTFEAYCRERWGMSKSRVYQMMEAASVVDDIKTSTIVDVLPTNEAQTRAMASVPQEHRPEVWKQSVETAPNGKVTAAHVSSVAAQYTDADEMDDEPLTPHEQQIAASYQSPPPAPASRFNEGMRSSDTPEWYTPRHIIDRVIELFGHIDLDPCSNDYGDRANVPARHHYTEGDNGLARSWNICEWTDDYGELASCSNVYMNPPYGDTISQWIERLVSAYESGEITGAVALLPARVDTAWWHQLSRYTWCAVRGRLRFSRSENSAPFPSAVVYLGMDQDGFADVFGDLGIIYRPIVF
jgi:hypothetical protein